MTAMVASQHADFWQRRSEASMHVPTMNISGLMSPYETPRSVTDSPVSRAYHPTTSHMDMGMPLFTTHAMTTSVPYQSGVYAYDSMPVNPYNMQQTYPINYTSSVPQVMPYGSPSDAHALSAVREPRSVYPGDRHSMVKAESTSPMQPSQVYHDMAYTRDPKRSHSEPTESTSIEFATDVDTLMKAIQAKQTTTTTTTTSAPRSEPRQEEATKPSQKPRKRYQCNMPDCSKSFYQKTHLEIHIRAHTGAKPFVCKAPSCGQRFSQLGNLKTHERRHTGERPYSCDICGKTFAQRGNVRAHKIVHQQIKPFTCKLDDCGKQFTQLGNLKSHQNKFHAATLRYLTQKFGTLNSSDWVSAEDKELWEYFASLYKNSNKGIKGRGKDRRIAAVPSSAVSHASSYTSVPMGSMHRGYSATYQAPCDRSSRGSSMSSDATHHRSDSSYDYTHMGPSYHQPPATGYDDMVFSERRMY